jgi:hypothetical protein
MFEADNRIHSPELAEVMAYAEVPFREIALHQKQYENEFEYESNVELANSASNLAGKEYLARLSINLSFHETSSHPEILSPQFVNATEQDMIKFAQENEDSKTVQTNMKRIWSAFNWAADSLILDFPDQFVMVTNPNHPSLRKVLKELRLNQDLIDHAGTFVRNIGMKQRTLLQSYYDSRIEILTTSADK